MATEIGAIQLANKIRLEIRRQLVSSSSKFAYCKKSCQIYKLFSITNYNIFYTPSWTRIKPTACNLPAGQWENKNKPVADENWGERKKNEFEKLFVIQSGGRSNKANHKDADWTIVWKYGQTNRPKQSWVS